VLAPTKDDLTDEGGVSLWYIARRAGRSEKSATWLINYVRMLIANEHFPPALPYFGLNAEKRKGLGIHSRWLRSAVDAWFDGLMPPHLVLVANDRGSARDGLLLDQRAEEIAAAGRLA
jgi:hypothetical protein